MTRNAESGLASGGDCTKLVVTFASQGIFKQVNKTAQSLFKHCKAVSEDDALAQAENILGNLPWTIRSPCAPLRQSRAIGRKNDHHFYLDLPKQKLEEPKQE